MGSTTGSHDDRCALCAIAHPARSKGLKPLPDEQQGELPIALHEHARNAWDKRNLPLVATGKVCKHKCWAKVLEACRPKTSRRMQSRSSTSEATAQAPAYQHRVRCRPSLLAAASLLRFDRVFSGSRGVTSSPAGWEQLGDMVSQIVGKPNDVEFRQKVWRAILKRPPGSSVRWIETLEAMSGDDLGPPMLLSSELASPQVADSFSGSREKLLALGDSSFLHEVILEGHALDPIGRDGCLIANQCLFDAEVTHWRFPLLNNADLGDGVVLGPLRDRFGWADPDIRTTCRLLEHDEAVPLLVWQRHACLPNAIAGEEKALVLMYSPYLPNVLPVGHPGRVALERLQPRAGESWMECKPLLPPDHAMSGLTVDAIAKQLKQTDKAYGHGHGFERLVMTHFCTADSNDTSIPEMNDVLDDDNGGNCLQRHLPKVFGPPPAKRPRRSGKYHGVKARRPLVGGNGVLDWDDASSALHYGTVNACIPAAEAALLLLPESHPCRRTRTRLAPYGRVWSYQVGQHCQSGLLVAAQLVVGAMLH